MKTSHIILAVVAVVILAGGGVAVYYYDEISNFYKGRPDSTFKPASSLGLISLPSGLDEAERAEFYHLAEGSEIYPVLWMQALKVKKGKDDPAKEEKYFLDDVERLGFLPDPDQNDKDHLPIGLTSGITRGLEALGPMSGLNCAACHVGELHLGGKRVRIDGAPNLLNTRQFFITVIESAVDTAAKPAKLIAFVVRVKEIEELKKKVETSPAKKLARKFAIALGAKAEEDLHVALQPVVQKIIDQEKQMPAFDFKAALKDNLKEADKFHAALVKGLKLDDVAELLKKSPLLKAEEAHAPHALTDFLQEIYVSARLLRARAEFLKKLGMVGNDERTDWGPGRVDAFGSARAFLFQDGYVPLNPVSYPPLFELNSHNWFHYDNNTNTFLERNFGQALGVGAVWDEKSQKYSLEPKNLRKLDGLARKITAPKWPETISGKIDQERAKRGKESYVSRCAQCHDVDKNSNFNTPDELKDVGTDPGRAIMFNEAVPKDNLLFPSMIQKTMNDINTVALKEFNDDEKKAIALELGKDSADWRGPTKYFPRTLKGAWATAPYLHNGSVPTLDDLLKPAKDRPKTFSVGAREYDVQKLGYLQDDKALQFDTSKPGNSNAGHEGKKYGTDLSDSERKDLLEYLKTL